MLIGTCTCRTGDRFPAALSVATSSRSFPSNDLSVGSMVTRNSGMRRRMGTDQVALFPFDKATGAESPISTWISSGLSS